jgi:hypothetical protein
VNVIANMGLPMLFVQLPYLAILLIPVIVIEAMVFCRRLCLPFRASLRGAALANVISTFVGFPLAWLALLGLQFSLGGDRAWGLASPAAKLAAVTLQAPWLIPYESELYWMIPAASLALLVPCLPISVLIEGDLLRRRWAGLGRSQVWGVVRLANGASYGLLLAVASVRLYLALNWDLYL